MTASAILTVLAALSQIPPAFESEVEMVRLDVLVARAGVPVNGLTAADFEVLDNGVPQAVELATWEQIPAHAILALDTSGSVSGEKLEHLEAAARSFLRGLKPADRATVLTFTHAVRLASPVGAAAALALRGLEQVHPVGSTALFDAAYGALSLADPRLGRNLVVVFSDGFDRTSWLSPEKLLAAAKASDVVVYVVALAFDAPLDERSVEYRSRTVVHLGPHPDAESRHALLELAAETGGRVWEATAGPGLEKAFLGVLNEVRSRYVLRYEPRGVTPGGWHRLDVRLKSVKGDVRVRRGYFGRAP